MINTEEKYGLKKGQAIALLIVLVSNVVWICCTVSRIITSGKITLSHVANIVMFAVTVYYVCYSYKKPHGNLMRYLLLFSAAYSAIRSVASNYPTYVAYACYLMIILKSYMAGRLDHYKQNVIISTVILACQCLMSYHLIDLFAGRGTLTFTFIMSSIGPVTLWLAIAASYIIRYKPHKEAGIKD